MIDPFDQDPIYSALIAQGLPERVAWHVSYASIVERDGVVTITLRAGAPIELVREHTNQVRRSLGARKIVMRMG